MSEDFADKHRNTKFSNNVEATLRQEPGAIHRIVCGSGDNYSGNGKSRITNRFGRLKMEEKTERNGDTDNVDPSSTARWIKPGKLHRVAPLLDITDFDETSVDLGSPMVSEVSQAALTYHDDMAMVGFFGNGYEGEDGDTVVPFKAANIVPHGGIGVTKAKLLQLRTLIRKRNAPLMRVKPIILLQPEDEAQLLSIDEYASADYNSSKPLEDGEIKPWLGFRFFGINPDQDSLPKSYGNFFSDGGATRNLPVIFPGGLHRGVWHEFMGKITQRDDKDYSWQYWGAARSAVVRTDEDLAFILKTQGN